MRYIVTQGIFAGHIFNGTIIKNEFETRVWDDDSIGRSFNIYHCRPLTEHGGI